MAPPLRNNLSAQVATLPTPLWPTFPVPATADVMPLLCSLMLFPHFCNRNISTAVNVTTSSNVPTLLAKHGSLECVH